MRYAPGIQSVDNKTVRYVYVDTWARNKQVTVWYSRYQPLTGLAWHTVFKSLRSDMRYAPGIQSVENKTVRYVYSSFLAKHRPERYQSWSITETQGQNSHTDLVSFVRRIWIHVVTCRINGRPAWQRAPWQDCKIWRELVTANPQPDNHDARGQMIWVPLKESGEKRARNSIKQGLLKTGERSWASFTIIIIMSSSGASSV